MENNVGSVVDSSDPSRTQITIPSIMGTANPYPEHSMIHHLFENQVQQTPDAIAVTFEQQRLTYLELDQRANQLAHHLHALGVKPNTLVALCVERSLDMLIGLLGILKAGGAYVPLDPAYPNDRLSYMLSDSQSSVLVTQADLVTTFSDIGISVVSLDSDWPQISQQPTNPVTSDAQSHDLAYVIYTSGSTGRPKGVQIAHQSVVNFLYSLRIEPGLSATDRLVAVTTLSFDIAGLELYLPLSVGAEIILASRTVAADGALLSELLETSNATVMQATPATWRLLLEAQWPGEAQPGAAQPGAAQPGAAQPGAAQLRIFCGGETLPRDLAEQLLPKCAELWNLYGPTEATIWSTVHRVETGTGPIPIGHPIANTQVYILDDELQPVAAGEPGELYIGGSGLALGYLNRPELTEERFVAHPSEQGQRLYRTGDLAKYRPDGTLEHLGRVDYQVKIRGFRIELGEIEAALTQQEAVRQAVVLAREDIVGDKRLVSYIVPDAEQTPSNQQLRAEASTILPDYMVPGTFVFLEQLPLTPNGKIDRNALPAPDTQRPESAEPYVAPRTADEETLAQIWSEVLRIDTVGVHDNYFELGGDSLKLAQIVTRIRDSFQAHVALKFLFEHPTVAGMMQVIDQTDRNRSLQKEIPIREVQRPEHIPLSFAQERVWFIHQLNPQNLAYNFQSTIRFRGSLDISALEHALSEVLRRHESYRTTFPAVNGRPVQIIQPHQPLSLPIIDFSDYPEQEQEAAVKAWCDNEFQKRFDLAQLSLVRWTLLRYSDQDHSLVHMEHHLVHDGWSFNMFLHELVDLYRAYTADQPSPLPELPVQFAEFAVWQHEWMQGSIAEEQLDYWKEKLAGLPPVLQLPGSRPRPAAQTFTGTSLRPEIPVELCNSLRELGRQERSTLFMTMLAAFIALLHRYTEANDIPIGTFFANRRERESESLIGMILNNVIIRASLAKNPSLRELVAQVRDVVLESAHYQDVPFDRVVTAVQPQRDPSFNPLFQVMFSFHDEPMPEHKLPGLDVKLTPVLSNGSAKFDLGVIGIPHSAQYLGLRQGSEQDGLTMIWEHNTDIIDTTTVARMITHYKNVLKALVTDPDQRVSELTLLSDTERDQMLVRWNTTTVDYPADACLHDLITAQAARTPEAIAVQFEDQSITYQALDQRSNQLAHYLRKHGVAAGVLVGISVERSIDMLVGLLGILKAGGVYVPIDPVFPQRRKAFMIDDANLSILVTQQHLRDTFSVATQEMALICLDSDHSAIANESENALQDGGVTAEDLAYVIYTSGSTGNPKGVQIPHRAIVNFLSTMQQRPGLNAQDRLMAVTTLSFDIAGLELYLPLTVGASVIIASRSTVSNGEELARQLAATKTTVMQATPTTWQMLIDAGWRGDTGLTALCGGEPLPRALAEQLLGRVKSLWNMYGPTETTIWSTIHQVRHDDQIIPIGRPIANTHVYVLDAHHNPVPIGVTGELYIGGAGIARGYLKRSELTAEKFIDHPLITDGSGAKIYRTGDLARYREDGVLECLGRTDHQIKMRGFRIELGEIEAVLDRHPAVQQSVVLMREDVPGDKRLVAYIVPTAGSSPTDDELSTHARQVLPDYMAPTLFITLDELPLTPNEKIDRRALPEPTGTRQNRGSSYLAPRNPTEQQLVAIWEQVLGVAPIGIQDDFFDVGGHSLLAMRLISDIEQKMGPRISLASLFHGRTIEHLANIIEGDRRVEAEAPFAPIQCEGSYPPFFAGGSHPRYIDIGRHLGPQQPIYRFDVYALQSQRLTRGLKPLKRIEDMASQFISDIRSVQPTGPYFLGGGCEAAIVAFEAALQLQRQGQQIACLIMWLAPPLRPWTISIRQSVPFRLTRQLRYLLTGHSLTSMSRKQLAVLLGHELMEYRLFRCIDRYTPSDQYQGKITLVRTETGSNSSHDVLNKQWEELATEGVEAHVLPGNHNTWLDDDAQGFSTLLSTYLRQPPAAMARSA